MSEREREKERKTRETPRIDPAAKSAQPRREFQDLIFPTNPPILTKKKTRRQGGFVRPCLDTVDITSTRLEDVDEGTNKSHLEAIFFS